jgi:cytosine deaminase
VFREGTRILHLDHSERPWITTVTSRPAGIMGLKDHGRLRPGMAADFVVFSARTMNEFLSRPQSDRMVVLAGRPVAAPLPDYAELDGLS